MTTDSPLSIWPLVARQRRELVTLLNTLSPEDWDQPSLCAGWNVRHIVAHIILESHYSMIKDAPRFVRAGFNFNTFMYKSALELGSQPPAQLIALLEDDINKHVAPILIRPIWVLADLIIHTQDLAIPLGREQTIDPIILEQIFRSWQSGRFDLGPWVVGISRLAEKLTLVAEDIDWRRGRGPVVSGRAHDLLLALAGRSVTLERLSGDGVALLRQRIMAHSSSEQGPRA